MARTRTRNGSTPTARSGGFELSTRYAAESAVVTLTDPAVLSGDPVDTGGRITICSVYSVAARDTLRRLYEKITVVAGKVQLSDEEASDSLLEQTIAVTVAANDWNLTENGAPIPITEATVRLVYTDPRTAWIGTQVRNAYLDLARFFGTGTRS